MEIVTAGLDPPRDAIAVVYPPRAATRNDYLVITRAPVPDYDDEQQQEPQQDAFSREKMLEIHGEVMLKDYIRRRNPKRFFFPLWNPAKRQVFLIAGPPRSGKSELTRNLAMQYQKQMPPRQPKRLPSGRKSKRRRADPRPVVLFSIKREDPTLDGKKPYVFGRIPGELDFFRYDITPESVQQLLDWDAFVEKFHQSLLIFDDALWQDPSIKGPLDAFLSHVLRGMAQYEIDVIYTCHVLRDGHNTKLIHTINTAAFIFPWFNEAMHMEKYMKERKFMREEEVQAVLRADSRWVMFGKENPRFVLTQKEAFRLQ